MRSRCGPGDKSSFDDDTHGVVIYDVAPPVNGVRQSLKVTDEPSH